MRSPRERGVKLEGCTVHKLVADALAVAEGKVLLVKYKDTAGYDGQTGWFIPDDAMEEPEHPESAAGRILYEQAGIKAKKLELAMIESFGHGAWHLIFHYKAQLGEAPKVKAGAKVKEAKWFPLGALPPREDCAHHGWAHDVIEKIAPAVK
jgi:ADP-ribose pyrophosphatase YjhB (NUDIX family)